MTGCRVNIRGWRPPGPVAGELGTRGRADVARRQCWQDRGGRRAGQRDPVQDQFRAGHARDDSVDEPAVGPRPVLGVEVTEPGLLDVLATEVHAPSGPVVDILMDRRDRIEQVAVDGLARERHQV